MYVCMYVCVFTIYTKEQNNWSEYSCEAVRVGLYGRLVHLRRLDQAHNLGQSTVCGVG